MVPELGILQFYYGCGIPCCCY